MSRRYPHPGRRPPRGWRSPAPVIVETVVPARTCCACCGSYVDDARCIRCRRSDAAGDDLPGDRPELAATRARAAGAGAAAALLLLALLLSKQDRLFS